MMMHFLILFLPHLISCFLCPDALPPHPAEMMLCYLAVPLFLHLHCWSYWNWTPIWWTWMVCVALLVSRPSGHLLWCYLAGGLQPCHDGFHPVVWLATLDSRLMFTTVCFQFILLLPFFFTTSLLSHSDFWGPLAHKALSEKGLYPVLEDGWLACISKLAHQLDLASRPASSHPPLTHWDWLSGILLLFSHQ